MDQCFGTLNDKLRADTQAEATRAKACYNACLDPTRIDAIEYPEMEADFEVLSKSAVGECQQRQVQLMHRVAKTVKASAALTVFDAPKDEDADTTYWPTKSPFYTDAYLDAVACADEETAALHQLLCAQQEDLDVDGPGSKAVEFAKKGLQQAQELWSDALERSTIVGESRLAPETLLMGPQILVKEELQTMLFKHPHRDEWPTIMREVGHGIAFLGKAVRKGLKLCSALEKTVEKALDIKTRLKTLLLTDYALDKMLHECATPANHLQIQRRLKEKGGLDLVPEHIRAVLSTTIGKPAMTASPMVDKASAAAC